MGQIHSSPPELNLHSNSNPKTENRVSLLPGDDTEDWVILERCTCGETINFTSDTEPHGRESKGVTLDAEQTNCFRPTEVPQSLVPVEYNLTSEVPVCTGNQSSAQSKSEEENEITEEGNDIGDVLFQGATWGYLGARWIIPPVPGVVEDMVATLQRGMGM